MVAFKTVATTFSVIAVLFLGLAIPKVKEDSSRNIIYFAMGIYLLSVVAIWI